MNTPCPCCGHEMEAPDVFEIAKTYKLSPLQMRVLEILWDTGGVVPHAEVAQRIWGMRIPVKHEKNTIENTINNLRKKLDGSPYEIMTFWRRGYTAIKRTPR